MNAVRRGQAGASTSAPGFCGWPRRGATLPCGTAAARGRRQPRRQGAPARRRRERAPRGPETRWAPAWSRGPERWAGDVGSWGEGRAAAGGGGRDGPRRAARGRVGPGGGGGRCGRRGRRGRGAQSCCPARPSPPPDAACCPGRLGCGTRAKSRRPRNEAPRRAVTPARPGPPERKPWGSQGLPHRTARSPGPEGLPGAGEGSCRPGPPQAWLPSGSQEPQCSPPVALPPQMAWEVAPSRMTVLAPWDPHYKARAGPRLVWGPSCASGASFSGRTLCHPSFWPLYEAAPGRDLRPPAPATGHQNGEHAPRNAGFPVMCHEDVFLSDPLLPSGQRVPLYLSEASQQVMGSLKLLLPPPIMSPWVLRTPSPGCSTAWLSGPELIALTGLLQMSQGAPRPASPRAPTPPAGPPDPVSDHPGPSGSPSCSHCTDPSVPRTPDAH
ncbi:histone deacetylase complex subunit SAP25 isoform X1 [Mirounga angustirostris]|uniref:histone deacetylase complex subunit SAP25 isoform X1 n=1 Tax=Mirounga angustirostris TaxID=9716 RepID=UPI00313E733F